VANHFAVDQWEHLHHLGDSMTQETAKADDEDDRRPRWDTPLSTPKKEWKSTIHSMRASSVLTEPAESAPFRSSLFPPSFFHSEADLKSKKAFKEAVLQTDAAGACGLSLVWCGKLAHATLGKESQSSRG
jgi:hypothetical protein